MVERLYDMWSKRDAWWEIRYQDSIMNTFSDYGKGVTRDGDVKGKLFGAGYELFIIAFFIGLYYNQRRPLNPDRTKIKKYGQPIQHWGNIDSVKGRKPYPKLKEYMFLALIAKTDIDLIALDKGEMSQREALDKLCQTMNEYANWGFNYMEDKLIDDPNYFYKETRLLELFLNFASTANKTDSDDDEPESLD